MNEPKQVYFDRPKGSFLDELNDLINKHSIEGGSNTPDYILTEYLKQSLEAFDMCTRKRDEYNHNEKPATTTITKGNN